MRQQIRCREHRSVLLGGQYGVGKTSCGLIYAKAILCEAHRDGEPCNECENCQEFGVRGDLSPNFHYVKCGEHGTIDKIHEVLELARVAPLAADRRVVLIDEAHNLSSRATQGLLDILEFPPKWARFILLTSDQSVLPQSLLSRLQIRELEPISHLEAFTFLSDVCRSEQLSFEDSALELVCSAVIGSPRTLLRALESVRDFGSVTEPNVRLALKLDFQERLAAYVHALVDGDLARQLQVIHSWPDSPGRKLDFLHQFFASIYLNELQRVATNSQVLGPLAPVVSTSLLEAFAARATQLGMVPERLWEELISALEPREGLTTSQLAMVLTKFNRLVNHQSSTESSTATVATRSRVQRLQRVRGSPTERSMAFLPWKKVRPIWDIGSFLPQEFGVLFNVRLTLRHSMLQIQDQAEAAALVSELTHRLADRVRYWSPTKACHWAYQHEADHSGVLRSRLLMAMPDELLGRALDWLAKFMLGRSRDSNDALLISTRRARSHEDLVRFHWQGIRAMSRCLDPAASARDEKGNIAPLLDLLRIPVRWRGPIGPMRVQSAGASKWLTHHKRRAAAAEMPFLSALREGAWSHLDTGWELAEFNARFGERTRRNDAVERIHILFPGADELSVAMRNEELGQVRQSFATDPKAWPRTWLGWWQKEVSKRVLNELARKYK